MVDWHSNAEIARDAVAFDNFMHTLLGLYLWEWATSLDFDWAFITRKKPFKWPLIFYFLGRYSLLFALIGIAIALNVTEEINCQSLYLFNALLGNSAIGLATVNLSLRTMAVWGQRWHIVVPLVTIILGHWALLLRGAMLTAQWMPGAGCVITKTDSHLIAVSFTYGMALDFLVLVLTAYRLGFAARNKTGLVQLVFADGLIYFAVAFVSNLIATTFMLLDLNPVMSIIANVPAAIISTIVACRSVRRLTNYNSDPSALYNGPRPTTLRFGPRTTDATTTLSTATSGRALNGLMSMQKKEEAHNIQMNTFPTNRIEDDCMMPPTPELGYDPRGNLLKPSTAFDAPADLERAVPIPDVLDQPDVKRAPYDGSL